MYIQERLQTLQTWAKTGIQVATLPSIEAYGTDEAELSLLQYCYYLLIDQVADNIIKSPNYDIHESVEILLSSPFGNCVSKEIVLALCELLMTSELRPYCASELFHHWTASDVAGTIRFLQGGSEDLWRTAKEDYCRRFQSTPE